MQSKQINSGTKMVDFRVSEKNQFDELHGSFNNESTEILEHLDKLITSIELLVNSYETSIHSDIADRTMRKIIGYLHFFSTTVKHHLYKYKFPCYKEYKEQHKRFLIRFVRLCNNLMNNSEETANKFFEFSKELLEYLKNFRTIYSQFVDDYKNNATS